MANDNPFSGRNDNVTRLDAARKKLTPANNDAPPSEPMLNIPPTVKALAGLTVAVFLVTRFLLGDTLAAEVLATGGFIPARYTGGLEFGLGGAIAPIAHVFLHGGWLHLFINLGMLLAFGAGLEKQMGARRMLVLYFASALIGALTHLAFYPDSFGVMIGASGAISGLFGGVLMMMYNNGAMGSGGYRRLLPFVAIWIGIALFFGMFGLHGEDMQIAWTTHIGGFLAGLLLFNPVMKMRG